MNRKTRIPNTIPFTQTGYQALITERDKLLKERIPAVKELQRAREMGDLKENGFYRGARFKLSAIDRRLKELAHLIRFGEIMEVSFTTETVTIGSKVTITDGKQTETFLLVGEYEANPEEHKLSNKSPIGYQLLGKKKGDRVTIQIPSGKITYAIVSVALP